MPERFRRFPPFLPPRLQLRTTYCGSAIFPPSLGARYPSTHGEFFDIVGLQKGGGEGGDPIRHSHLVWDAKIIFRSLPFLTQHGPA